MENICHVTVTRRLKCHEHQLRWSSIKGTTRWMAGRRSVTQWALKRKLRKWRDLWDFARQNVLLHSFYKQTNRPVIYLKDSVLADHGLRHHWIWSITEKMAESDSLATLTKVIRNNKKTILPSFSVCLDLPHVYPERLLALSARPVLPSSCCGARTQVIIICVLNNVNIIIVVNNEQSIPRSCLTSRVIDSQTYVGSGLVMASRLLFDSGRFKQINFNLLSFLFSQLFGDRSRHGHRLLCHNAGKIALHWRPRRLPSWFFCPRWPQWRRRTSIGLEQDLSS